MPILTRAIPRYFAYLPHLFLRHPGIDIHISSHVYNGVDIKRATRPVITAAPEVATRPEIAFRSCVAAIPGKGIPDGVAVGID